MPTAAANSVTRDSGFIRSSRCGMRSTKRAARPAPSGVPSLLFRRWLRRLRREKIANLVHEGLRARIVRTGVAVADLLEFAQDLVLPGGEFDRRFHGDVAIEVAGHRSAHRPDPLVAKTKHLAGLRFRWNLDLGVTVERRNVDLPAERRLREADRHFAMKVGAFALEHRVRLQIDDDVEVASGAAVHPRLAFAAEP